MRMTTAYALIWIATAVAVSVGIIVTGRLVPLWALLIPSMISIKSGESN